jgi:hypothetical protein
MEARWVLCVIAAVLPPESGDLSIAAVKLGTAPAREICMTSHRILALAIVLAIVSAHQARAQFGDTPGMPGSLGFGARPAGPPPACQQLMVLREETQKNGAAVGAAQQRKVKADVVEACKLLKVFLASEAKFVAGMTENSATCGVPPEVIKQYQEGHGKASQVGRQVCEAAEHQHSMPNSDRYDAPFLFDGIIPRRGP